MIEHSIADKEVRDQALDPGSSFIVQAPAGSGKTELLMQRYLLLLSLVAQPEEIIAITFTRKATAEMRSRILNALHNASQDITLVPAPTIAHELKTWQLARKVLERDQEYHWQLQQNPNRLRILTIDSLCASLARQMPILSRAGVNPQTTEDASELYRQAAQKTLESLLSRDKSSKDIARLLTHLDNDWQKLEAMLCHLLQRRDHWLRHLPPAGDSGDLQQERENLEAGLRAIIEVSLKEIQALVPEDLQQEWSVLASGAAENLRQQGSDHLLVACAGMQNLPQASADQLHLWQALADLVLTKDSWRKSITKAIGFPAPSSTKDPDQKRQLEANKGRMLALIEKLSDSPYLLTQLCAIRELPAPAYSDDQWLILKSLFNVLKLAVAQLEVVFRERGQVDFIGVNLAALDALIKVQGDDYYEPTDLALALDYQIKHLLVDEFQDTSVSQYSLLKQLTAGWEPEDGRSLFLVGDPMQSIYRFREAEVGLFLNVQQSGFLGHVAVKPLQLQVNFRSDHVVVEWVNQVFEKAMPAQASVTTGAVSYSRSIASESISQESISQELDGSISSASVQLHPLIEPPDQAEAKLVCELLEKARQREGSVAILVRNKTHLIRITRAMQERGINYQAVELEALMQRPVIRDLHALTRALLHPADKTAWLSILRAPWCGLTLDDLETLSSGSQQTIWDLINNSERSAAMSEDGQRRLSRVQPAISSALAQRRRQSLARWVERVWLGLGGPACVENVSDLDNAQNYFTLIDQLDEGTDLASFYALEHALARLFAAPQTPDQSQVSIQLMTIHKSKGLEFDTVIIPGLQRLPRNDDRQLLQWTEWRKPGSDMQDQDALLLAPIEETGNEKAAINRYISTLEKERSRYESVRLLYVAATRAQRHLHLIGSLDRNTKGELKKPDPRSLLARVWDSVEADFLSQAEQQARTAQLDTEVASEPEQFVPYIRRLSADWELPTFPEPLEWTASIPCVEGVETVDQEIDQENDQKIDETGNLFVEYSWAGAPAKHIGTVTHRLLQQIAEQGLEVWDKVQLDSIDLPVQRSLRESGASEAVIPMATERVKKSLVKTLKDDRGRWILSDKHQDSRNEYGLTGVIKGALVSVILDRTFIDQQGVRWVVDYKTSSHEGGDLQGFLDNEQLRYQPQLERYAQLLKKMEDRPTRLALYFPLLSGWRAWSPEEL